MPQAAEEQAKLGFETPLDDLRLGDLVFYDEDGTLTVGMYLENGYIAFSDTPKTSVIHLSEKAPAFARRLLVMSDTILPEQQAPLDSTLEGDSNPPSDLDGIFLETKSVHADMTNRSITAKVPPFGIEIEITDNPMLLSLWAPEEQDS